MRLSTKERFDRMVSVVPITGCWLWMGRIRADGYGTIAHVDGQRGSVGAHRVSFSLYKGRLVRGLTIDHLCRNRWCVNPAHLEQVTLRENTLRGENIVARNARATHCHRGHELSDPNVYVTRTGGRRCRKCNAIAIRCYKLRKREASC